MSGQSDVPGAQDSAPVNLFDFEVKYGALVIALAYLVGYSFEQGFGLRLGVPSSEMQLSAASLLVRGFTLLFSSLFPSLFSLGYLGYLRFIDKSSSNMLQQGSAESAVLRFAPLIYGAAMCAYFYVRHSLPVYAVVFTVVEVTVMNAAVGLFLIHGERTLTWKLNPLEQLATTIAVLLMFRTIAYNYGKIAERGQEGQVVQLLIAPDAIDGARQVGIPFRTAKSSAGSEQLSDPVSFAYQGEHSYFLVLRDGAVVRFSKDKVWAVHMVPQKSWP